MSAAHKLDVDRMRDHSRPARAVDRGSPLSCLCNTWIKNAMLSRYLLKSPVNDFILSVFPLFLIQCFVFHDKPNLTVEGKRFYFAATEFRMLRRGDACCDFRGSLHRPDPKFRRSN